MNIRKYYDKLDGRLNIVGKIIQSKRESLNYSRQYVSDRLMNIGIDISEHAIYEIEIGKRTVIDYELGAIAKILNISSDELLRDFYKDID
ncbi:MAG: helix-turn-helix transcriptional regulator [Clostridia bacterium]|nr:helix-turn-helix transcriptional regulator [Clostridia bacterium]